MLSAAETAAHSSSDPVIDKDAVAPFDPLKVRLDFPVLSQQVNGVPLVYLDNAASAQTPQQVLQALRDFYERDYANVHRGVHQLSARATAQYETARAKVQRFVNARAPEEIVFTRSATEAINLVAHSFGDRFLGVDDEVLITELEHHSNIVPWQLACARHGARLRVCPIDDSGTLDLQRFEQLLNSRTKIVAVAHVSNALGTVLEVREIAARAHAAGALVLVDGAQATPHLEFDVQGLDCDFYVFSGHKLYGPTGIGVLYGKAQHLDALPPYQGGGEMIEKVTFERTTYAPLPAKFEAGTPNIAGAIGLGAAIDYLTGVGLKGAAAHEARLLQRATAGLAAVKGARVVGTAADKVGVLSFVLDGIHPHDIGTILDLEGIAIRVGHHCAQPLMARLGVVATARASFAFYNTIDEVTRLIAGIKRVQEVLG